VDGNDDRIASQYYREVGLLPNQTPERERTTFAAYRAACDSGNKTKATRLRHEIACGYVKFVMQRAHRRTKNRDLRLDLIAEGNIGLMVAIDKFDNTYGTRFLTYAAPWIEVYMREFINKSLPVHMPNHKRKELRRVRAAEDKLIALGILRDYSAFEPTATSIDNVSVAANSDVEDDAQARGVNMLAHIEAAGLSFRERFVVVYHYGLRGGDTKNFRDLAALLYLTDGTCLTSEQVRQIRDAGTSRLTAHLTSLGLESAAEVQ